MKKKNGRAQLPLTKEYTAFEGGKKKSSLGWPISKELWILCPVFNTSLTHSDNV